MVCFYMDGVQLSQGYGHFEEAVCVFGIFMCKPHSKVSDYFKVLIIYKSRSIIT